MTNERHHFLDGGYVVYATTTDGHKVVVAEALEKLDLLHLKDLLVMRSEQFDDNSRLTQYRQNGHRSGSGVI